MLALLTAGPCSNTVRPECEGAAHSQAASMPAESLLLIPGWNRGGGRRVRLRALALFPHMYVPIIVAGFRAHTVHRALVL
jgi:hypothetical protein